MKTAILQQFSSKKSKNVYHDVILKKLKLHCHSKIVQNIRFSLQKNTSYKDCYFAVFAAVFQ